MAVGSDIYPLRIGVFLKIMSLGVPLVLTTVGFAIPFAQPEPGSPSPALFAILWFGFLGFFWYQLLSLPLTIVHRSDDVLEFRALLRTRRVAIADLRAIEPVPNQFGMLRFRHAKGKIVVLNQFDGFHKLIAAISAKNSSIQLRGV